MNNNSRIKKGEWNVTIHLSESKLRSLDKLAKCYNTSRNKLVLYCIEYAIDNQNFLDELIKKSVK